MKSQVAAKHSRRYWETVGPPMAFSDQPKTYEEKRAFRYHMVEYLPATFHFDKFAGKKVLEVGCGTGIDALEFARHGAQVFAVDFSETSVESAKRLFAEAGLQGEIQWGKAQALPFADNFFDCVYSCGVLHHTPEIEKALSEIHRVLKPNGTVMVMLYHRDSLLVANLIYFKGIKEGWLQKMSVDELISHFSERIEGNPYTKAYTKEEAQTIFSQFFREVSVQVKYDVIDLPEQRKVKIQVPEHLDLGWHLVLKAKK